MSYESKYNHSDVETECRSLLDEGESILLYGPPSCGKTTLTQKLRTEYKNDGSNIFVIRGGTQYEITHDIRNSFLFSNDSDLLIVETPNLEVVEHFTNDTLFTAVRYEIK